MGIFFFKEEFTLDGVGILLQTKHSMDRWEAPLYVKKNQVRLSCYRDPLLPTHTQTHTRIYFLLLSYQDSNNFLRPD